ncbi:MAG: hypothetical protein KKA42_06130 [candidate division Zixibacteria bacterium]|nr:hypothetical protein [candidate division Zixibacteria bacterium]
MFTIPCQQRFGGLFYLANYNTSSCHYDDTPTPAGLHCLRNEEWVWPTHGFVASELYANMQVPGYTHPYGDFDLHGLMVYDTQLEVVPDDTNYVYTALFSILDGYEMDLTPTVEAIREWFHNQNYSPSCNCCFGTTGNANGDPLDKVDVGDLVRIIDYLFISGWAPECMTEANIDADPLGSIDIGDLTLLIRHLFVTFEPLPDCP